MPAERDERLYLADGPDAVDRVLHGYFTVDLEIVWEIVETELPPLRDRLAALLPGV